MSKLSLSNSSQSKESWATLYLIWPFAYSMNQWLGTNLKLAFGLVVIVVSVLGVTLWISPGQFESLGVGTIQPEVLFGGLALIFAASVSAFLLWPKSTETTAALEHQQAKIVSEEVRTQQERTQEEQTPPAARTPSSEFEFTVDEAMEQVVEATLDQYDVVIETVEDDWNEDDARPPIVKRVKLPEVNLSVPDPIWTEEEAANAETALAKRKRAGKKDAAKLPCVVPQIANSGSTDENESDSDSEGQAQDDFLGTLQQSLVEFQNAWDAGDWEAELRVARDLKKQSDNVAKTRLSNSLEMLICSSGERADALYMDAVAKFLEACRSEMKSSSKIDTTTPRNREPLVYKTSLDQATEPVTSSLPMEDEMFREISIDFVPQLDSKLRLMDEALLQRDFEEIAKLASWLKGAGGTCGFGQFTEPSDELQVVAHESDLEECALLIERLWYLGSQIVIENTIPIAQ